MDNLPLPSSLNDTNLESEIKRMREGNEQQQLIFREVYLKQKIISFIKNVHKSCWQSALADGKNAIVYFDPVSLCRNALFSIENLDNTMLLIGEELETRGYFLKKTKNDYVIYIKNNDVKNQVKNYVNDFLKNIEADGANETTLMDEGEKLIEKLKDILDEL